MSAGTDLERSHQQVQTHVKRVLATFAWMGAGLGTLMVLGPGLDFLPPVVLPIAGAVAAISLIPSWRAYRDWSATKTAMEVVASGQESAKLKKLKDDLATVPTAPEDARMQAARQLLARIREQADGDPEVLKAAEATDRELIAAVADVRMLGEALEADRAVAGAQGVDERLQLALATREAEVDELIRATRALHASLSLADDSAGPVLAGLQRLLDQADAEGEIRALGAAERARRARGRQSV